MRKIAIYILTLFALGIANCQNANYKNLNSQEFYSIIDDTKGTLLDVRTPSEFAHGHLEDAGQINYYALDFKRKLLLLSKEQPVFLYCNTGYRSKRAAEILIKNGYQKVYNLEKGIMDWNLNNLPVVVELNAQTKLENLMEPDEFYALIESDKPVFIDFYAPWCAPCRKMMPMIDSLKTKYKDKVTVVKINVDASKKLVKELQLGSVPYFALYKSGKKQYEHFGTIDRNILEKKVFKN